jgi:hypothetical protein
MKHTSYPINTKDTIFIALSAFDDELLFDTIRNCLSQAEYPQLLHFGVVQYSINPVMLPEDLANNPRIIYINFTSSFAPGTGITRNLTYHLYNNQAYYFQTDSHMYMSKHWDSKLITMYKHLKTKYDKFVISGHMEGFVLDENKQVVINSLIEDSNKETEWLFLKYEEDVYVKKNVPVFLFKENRFVHSYFKFIHKEIDRVLTTNMYEEYFMISAAFLFCDKKAIPFIEPDPKIVFGEEPSLFFRLKSQDYKIFKPHKKLLFHYHDKRGQRNIKANFLPILLQNSNQRIQDTFTGKLLGYWGAKDLDSYNKIIKFIIIKK